MTTLKRPGPKSIGMIAFCLGVHPDTIRHWVKEGLPCWYTLGGHRRFNEAEVVKWVNEQSEARFGMAWPRRELRGGKDEVGPSI